MCLLQQSKQTWMLGFGDGLIACLWHMGKKAMQVYDRLQGVCDRV